MENLELTKKELVELKKETEKQRKRLENLHMQLTGRLAMLDELLDRFEVPLEKATPVEDIKPKEEIIPANG